MGLTSAILQTCYFSACSFMYQISMFLFVVTVRILLSVVTLFSQKYADTYVCWHRAQLCGSWCFSTAMWCQIWEGPLLFPHVSSPLQKKKAKAWKEMMFPVQCWLNFVLLQNSPVSQALMPDSAVSERGSNPCSHSEEYLSVGFYSSMRSDQDVQLS